MIGNCQFFIGLWFEDLFLPEQCIFRILPRGGSLLESNMVQTTASAGESLAAGIIFTMPALVLAGVWESYDGWDRFWVITTVAFTGGVLGILFMIPMRRVFVVDNKELPYPEGVACAEQTCRRPW